SGPDYLNDTFTTDGATLSAPLTGLSIYPGTYQMNIQALDAQGNQGLWNTSLSFDYNPSVPNPTYTFISNNGGAYGVPGQPVTIQVSDLNTASPDVFALISGPDGMTVDPDTGLVSWTPTPADLAQGGAYAVVAVTNAVGTGYASIPI